MAAQHTEIQLPPEVPLGPGQSWLQENHATGERPESTSNVAPVRPVVVDAGEGYPVVTLPTRGMRIASLRPQAS